MAAISTRGEAPWLQTDYNRPILGLVWTLTIITTTSLACRLWIRYQRFARLFWDDVFVVLAWLLSIPLAAETTVSNLHSKQESAGPGPAATNRVLSQFFFYTSVWSIKISFLIFFRKMGGTALPRLRTYWKVVAGITVLTYFVLWTFLPYGCFIQKGVTACALDSGAHRLQLITYPIACVLDVLTDCLIMAIPFTILNRVQLSRRKKFILYSIFSLTVLTMATAIVRTVLGTLGTHKKLDITLLLFLLHVEASTAIIVACLGSLRTLFTQDNRTRTASHTKSGISAPIRGRIVRTESAEALRSTDLQYITPKSVEFRSTADSRSGDLGTIIPPAHIRAESHESRKAPYTTISPG